MRIISGLYRGRTLPARLPEGVRPTLDAARESLFNMLHHQCDWDSLRVADIFAGSGALGIEALSRGAAHVTFVEKNRRVVRCIEQNLSSLKVSDEYTRIECRDALDFLQTTRQVYDLVFLDPPYALHALNPLLQVILERQLLSPDALIVAEHGSAEHLLHDTRLELVNTKHFGETTIDILRLKSS